MVAGRGRVSDICRQMSAQTNFICILSRKLQLFLFFTCTHKYFKSWRRGVEKKGEGRNIKNDCWLVIAYIGAAYKNREGSPASLFRRCGTSDVTTMNNRNGNSNSAAAPVRPLDPTECEEWSAASVRECVWVCVVTSSFFSFSFDSTLFSYFIPCAFISLYFTFCAIAAVSPPFYLPFPFFCSMLQTVTIQTIRSIPRQTVFNTRPAERLS